MTLPRSDWRDDAECAKTDIHHPDTWFDDPFYAREICLTRCPVVNECREWALRAPNMPGVVGGMAENERRQIRRRENAAAKKAAKKKEEAA